MKVAILSVLFASALTVPAAADDTGLLAPYLADKGELLKIFDADGGLGVLQVGERVEGEAMVPLEPRYAGIESRMGVREPEPAQREEEDEDLRDSLAPVRRPSWFRRKDPAAEPDKPAGWLVVNRKNGREVRPLATREEVARWAAVADAQRRAYERLLRQRRARDRGLRVRTQAASPSTEPDWMLTAR